MPSLSSGIAAPAAFPAVAVTPSNRVRNRQNGLAWWRSLAVQREITGLSCRLNTSQDRKEVNAMDDILDLQKLAVPDAEFFFGNSCSSSASNCCNGKELSPA